MRCSSPLLVTILAAAVALQCRYLDLFAPGGMDDFFSTATAPADRTAKLEHMCTAGQHTLDAAVVKARGLVFVFHCF